MVLYTVIYRYAVQCCDVDEDTVRSSMECIYAQIPGKIKSDGRYRNVADKSSIYII